MAMATNTSLEDIPPEKVDQFCTRIHPRETALSPADRESQSIVESLGLTAAEMEGIERDHRTSDKLDQPCRDDHLSKIALSLTDWQSIAPFLGLTEADEEEIKRDYPNTKTQKIAMLRKWKNRFGKKNNYRNLVSVFWELERADLVDKVNELLEIESKNSSSCEDYPPPAKRKKTALPAKASQSNNSDIPPLDLYAEYLRGRYRTKRPMFSTLQWPPTPTRKIFHLAMIHRQPIQHGTYDEELVRLIQRGNVDDILKRKTEVKLENIFNLDNENRKVILIEGAPGAGKSTLAWDVCRKWESGVLFQKFKVVIFVQLRDPSIQSAKTLADILPARSGEMCREVQSAMEACDGEGVLFVLDGWDEYGTDLQVCSLFQQLICTPGEINMHFSSLIITSRPIASLELQQYASSRVEIVGFTSAEVKRHFSESIGDSNTVQKFHDHLRVRPVIEASCYLPLNAAIVAHIFLASNNTLPHTLHEVFSLLVCCCLRRHLIKQVGEGKQIPQLSSLEDLPPNLQQPFESICAMAYHGVMENKASYSMKDLQSFNLPTEMNVLGLIQAVQSFMVLDTSISYHFLHLSIQELLAAFHISKLPATEQIQLFKNTFNQTRLAAVFRFYAAFTKLQTEGVRDIVARMITREAGFINDSAEEGSEEESEEGSDEGEGDSLEDEEEFQEGPEEDPDYKPESQEESEDEEEFEEEEKHFEVELEGEYKNQEGSRKRLAYKEDSEKECDSQAEISKEEDEKGSEGESGEGSEYKGEPEQELEEEDEEETVVKECSKPFLRHILHCLYEAQDPSLCEFVASHLDGKLSLSENVLSPLDCLVVGYFLSCVCLTDGNDFKVDLNACSLDDYRISFLVRELSKCSSSVKSLRTLEMSYNDLSDDGIIHIADLLEHNSCLQVLDISDCGIGDRGLELLATSLQKNDSLERLDLSDNIAVTGVGLLALGKKLKRNKGLKTLLLIGISISDDDWEQFIMCLQANNDLTKLYLSSSSHEVVQQETEKVNNIRQQKDLPLLKLAE